MKYSFLFAACLVLLCTCKKDDEGPTTKASFDFSTVEANKNKNLFTYYGNTTFDAPTNAVLITEANTSQYGGAFYKYKQDISTGFEVEFDFSITKQGGILDCYNNSGGDGLAFVILAGDKITVSPGGGLGYSGTQNSLAFEIDTWRNYDLDDPDGNHISLHSGEENANNADESYSYGSTSNISNMSDGSKHTFGITYRDKTLEIFLNGTKVLASQAGDFDIAEILTMTNNLVYMGFTATTGSAYERHNIQRFKLKML